MVDDSDVVSEAALIDVTATCGDHRSRRTQAIEVTSHLYFFAYPVGGYGPSKGINFCSSNGLTQTESAIASYWTSKRRNKQALSHLG